MTTSLSSNKGERHGTLKSYGEAPRWAGLSTFLRKVAWMLDLDIKINIEKGFIRETVFFEVEGTESKLLRFKEITEDVSRDYNKD